MYDDLFKKAEAVLVTDASNRFYFSRFGSSFGVVLLTPSAKYLFTDFRYALAAKQSVKDCEVIITDNAGLYPAITKILAGKKIKTVGYEDRSVSVAEFKALKKELKDFDLKPVGAEADALRIVKTQDEIDCIKKAQAVTEAGLTKTLPYLKPGVSEREISAELTYQFTMLGADGLAFDNIVAFGDNSADCHHSAGDRKLDRNDIVLFDIGAKVGGYCSDMTRTFCFGEPAQRLNDLHLLVLSAQQYVLKHLKAGITGKEADSMAREFFKANGYDKEFGHSLGHGVGVDIHEAPRLSQLNDTPLPENAVVTVEPGLYIDDFGGVRIEDMVVLKKDGIENLTNYNKSLIIEKN